MDGRGVPASARQLAGFPKVLEVLKNDVLCHLGAARTVKTSFNKNFKAFGCFCGQDNRERLGLGAGWRLGHALLLQCLSNAFKVILATGVGGRPIAANGISNVQDRKSSAADRSA